MSAKVTLSYTDDAELKNICEALKPYIHKCKVAKMQKSQYKRAYFELKNDMYKKA